MGFFLLNVRGLSVVQQWDLQGEMLHSQKCSLGQQRQPFLSQNEPILVYSDMQ